MLVKYMRDAGMDSSIPFYVVQNKIDLPDEVNLKNIQDLVKVKKYFINNNGFDGVIQTSACKAIGMGKVMHMLLSHLVSSDANRA